jgi:hypothetical protein
MFVFNEMQNQIYNTVGTVLEYNRKSPEEQSTTVTHKYTTPWEQF